MLSLTLASGCVLLLVLLSRLRSRRAMTEARLRVSEEKARSQAEDLVRMDSERRLLSGFLGVLPALAQELRHAGTERQIATTLIDTLVSTIEPRQAAVLMRRKRGRDAGPGQHSAVAATTPGSSTVPGTGDRAVRRRARGGQLPWRGAPACGAHAGRSPLTAPLYLDTQVVGLIALTPSPPGPEVPLIVQAVDDVGSLALHEASARKRALLVANIDELTQLFNKRYISRALAYELSKAKHGQHPVSVLLFDIDHFKIYNDLNGHVAGDFLLRLLGQLVQNNLRATDMVGALAARSSWWSFRRRCWSKPTGSPTSSGA